MSAVNLKLSHMGIAVRDMNRMVKFYTDVLGFIVTDSGDFANMRIAFLSRDPDEHHQLVFQSGRPAQFPINEHNADFGAGVTQISFKMASLEDLKAMRATLIAGGATNLGTANHGNAWSIYAHDPEGNTVEFFVDSAWYAPQPFFEPLDLDRPVAEITETTRQMCEARPGFKTRGEWQDDVAKKMPPAYQAA